MDPGKIVEEFRSHMASHGLVCEEEIIPDGKWHRFHAVGLDKKGSDDGTYRLFADQWPNAKFGTWKNPYQWLKSHGNPGRKLTAKEEREFREKVAEREKQREAEEALAQMEAAARAKRIWDSASTVPADFPYLVDKKIHPGALRLHADCLVIPMKLANDSSYWSLQFIDEHGNKRFLADGRVQGCYYTIAAGPPAHDETILICEGYATGATLHEATKLPVVVAFNCGNLKPAAEQIRTKFPANRLVFCADNDAYTEKNPGIHHARIAAVATNGLIAYPSFENPEPGRTDFNDLARAEGLDEVAAQVDAAKPPISEPVPEPVSSPQQLEHAPATPPALVSGGPAIIDFPHLGGRGKPMSTIENVDELLRALGIVARYDVIRKNIDLIIPGSQYLVDTAKNDKLAWLVSRANYYKLPKADLEVFIGHVAGQNPYNPVAEWISSKPWDGTSRLQEFFNTITAVNEIETSVGDFKETLMRKWMISAIAAAFKPNGVVARGVLTLQAPQNLGKTAWFKSLVPAEMEVIADGVLLDPRDKDSVYQCVSRWLVELGEVDATFRRSDIAQLKSFLTRDRDVLRRPFARLDSEFARRTVFFASVNPEDFLADPTGSTRFWTIQCETINYKHGLDMQQVWAEFYTLYQAGEGWYLDPGEVALLNNHNRDFETTTPSEELVRTKLNWEVKDTTKWIEATATEIAISIGVQRVDERELKRVAKAIREITGQSRIRHAKGWVYKVPPLNTATTNERTHWQRD